MDINFDDLDFSQGRKRKSCTVCNSIEHTKPACPNNPCSHCNEIGHIYKFRPNIIDHIWTGHQYRKC